MTKHTTTIRLIEQQIKRLEEANEDFSGSINRCRVNISRNEEALKDLHRDLKTITIDKD